MSLRIRAVQIRVQTTAGVYGCDFAFGDGLVVIHSADNSAGKSTTLLSILYGLGLERMISPSSVSPFVPAMTTRLETEQGDAEVIESRVAVEIENANKARLTCYRKATGDDDQRKIITVAMGGALTEPQRQFQQRSFVARDPGSATSDDGIYPFLAQFLGLSLPTVPRFDSAPGPLYLECLFSLLFVEQLSGWRSIGVRVPTFLRIPEVWDRTIEYLLKLDRLDRATARDSLEREAGALKNRWTALLAQAQIDARGVGFVVNGVPDSPPAEWPIRPSPYLHVVVGQQWAPLERAIDEAASEVRQLNEVEIPRVREVADKIAEEARVTEDRLNAAELLFEDRQHDIHTERAYLESLDSRITELEEDRRKYQDALKISAVVASSTSVSIAPNCPMCGQIRPLTLLPPDGHFPVMTLEANLAHVKGQIGLADDLKAQQSKVLRAKEQSLIELQQQLNEYRSLLREQRKTLRSDADAPSAEAIRKRLLAEDREARLRQLLLRWEEHLAAFGTLATQWGVVQGKLKSLGSPQPSFADTDKRETLRTTFIEMLKSFGFSSLSLLDLDTIQIDERSYRPTFRSHDLVGISASDNIRAIWAYLLSLLELTRHKQTNHPGLLILDEPRQQAVKREGFAALIKRAANSAEYGQQVIMATSEDEPDLKALLETSGSQYIEITGKVLKRIEDAPTS